MKLDGTGARRVTGPMINFQAVSPDAQWVTASAAVAGRSPSIAAFAWPVAGGDPIMLCNGDCGADWSLDGKYIRIAGYSIPLTPGEMIPPVLSAGSGTAPDPAHLPGARLLPPWPSRGEPVYAYIKTSIRRNIYRVPIP